MLGRHWRLVDTGYGDGVANMAIDEALLQEFDPESSAPVLRLYGWRPPAISLGRFQDSAAVLDLDRCRSRDVPVVRRITGGGAIYHADELTYSIVCAPAHIPGGRSVKESYRHLNRFLIDFYRSLGVPAAFAADAADLSGRFGARAAFCFAGREAFDIVAFGRKLGGNAQRRIRGAVFQHGSIPLSDRVREAIGFLLETPSLRNLSTASLRDLGVDVSENDLKGILTDAFSRALRAVLTPSELTATERERANAVIGRASPAIAPM